MNENTARKLVIELAATNGFKVSKHSPGYYRVLPNGSWVSMRSCKHGEDWLVLVAWVKQVVTLLGDNSFGSDKSFNTPAGIQEHITERIETLTK